MFGVFPDRLVATGEIAMLVGGLGALLLALLPVRGLREAWWIRLGIAVSVASGALFFAAYSASENFYTRGSGTLLVRREGVVPVIVVALLATVVATALVVLPRRNPEIATRLGRPIYLVAGLVLLLQFVGTVFYGLN